MEKLQNAHFAQEIIRWYTQHQRALPWRETSNPYFVWLSEIILQQTRVKQGMPYYKRFVEKYPTIEDLAAASEDEVLRLWQGLGYYSRGRNLHFTARYIVHELRGKFPDTYKALLTLKGVGAYTAAAIASFAFGEAVAVVDGNVYRVLARFFGISLDIASQEGIRYFARLAQSLIPEDQPGTYNQAIMEFGALQCTPKKPNCLFCPLRESCKAFHSGKQDVLPVKMKKGKIRERHFQYIVFHHQDLIFMKKRGQEDIWGGLYDFYLLESEHFLSPDALMEQNQLGNYAEHLVLGDISQTQKHLLSHQRIYAQFMTVELRDRPALDTWLKAQELLPYTYEAVKQLPKPILIDKFLQKKFFA